MEAETQVRENRRSSHSPEIWSSGGLSSRFRHDLKALVEWMGGARRVIDTWRPLPGSEEADVDLVQKHLVQSVVRTAEPQLTTRGRGQG